MLTSDLYRIKYAGKFKRSYKRLLKDDKKRVDDTLALLAKGEPLPPKYCNHRLNGKFNMYWECHVRGDLCLLYQIDNNELILIAIDVGSHSALGI